MSPLRLLPALWALLAASATQASTLLAATAGETAGAARRELSTDRPDATESPFTVEPGHFQVEMDFASYCRDKQDGTRLAAWEIAPFNLRIGVTQNSEAGIFVTPYHRERETDSAGTRVTRSGHGDIGLRGKLNFGGNDGGDFAWGIIADLKLPTGSSALTNKKYEGGLTLPLAFELGQGWSGGAMTVVEMIHSDAGRRRAVWTNSFTTSRDLSANVGMFLELISSVGDGSHAASFNCGLTRALGRDAQLDCGVNIGISRSAPDSFFFAGVSRRF